MSKYFPASSKYFNYFNRQKTQSVQDKISDLENTLEQNGVNVPPKVQRSALDRFLNLLGIGNYTIMGSVNEQEKFKQAWKNSGGTDFSTITNPLAFVLRYGLDQKKADEYTKYVQGINKASTKGIVEGLKGANPFGEKYEEGRKTATDVFDTVGWKNDNSKPWYSPANLGRGATAFIADVATDPTSYMTFGAGGLVRGTGKTLAGKAAEKTLKEGAELTAEQLAKLSARELAQYNIDKTFAKLGTKGVIDELAKVGVKVTEDEVPDIIKHIKDVSKAYRKPTGMSSFGSRVDDALREIGDRTIAPYVNTGIDIASKKLAATKPGKYFLKVKDTLGDTFNHTAKLTSEMAKNDPIRYMKEWKGAVQYTNKAFISYQKMQHDFQKDVLDKFADVPDEVKRDITYLTETPDAMKKFENIVHSHDVTRLSDEAVKLTKTYDKYKAHIEDIIDAYRKTGENEKALNLLESYKTTMDNIKAVGSQQYGKLLNASTDLKEVFKNEDTFEQFLNNVRNDSIEQIEVKLKEMGVTNARKAAYETRAILDSALDGVDDTTKKYFVGQQTLHKPINMDAGRPNSQITIDGVDEVIPDPVVEKTWYDKWNAYYNKTLDNLNDPKYTNTAIPDIKTIQNQFLKRYEKEMTPEDYLFVQKMFNDEQQLKKYNSGIIRNEIDRKGSERLQQVWVKEERDKIRKEKIDTILEQYENTLPNTTNAIDRENARQGWMMRLSSMSDKDLEVHYQNALKYKASQAEKINKHDELARKIAGYITNASKATQAKANIRSFKDIYALMSGKSYDELLDIQKQLMSESKSFNFRDIANQVDSGTAKDMADRIETDRFKKNAKEYAASTRNNIDDILNYIDNNIEQGKYIPLPEDESYLIRNYYRQNLKIPEEGQHVTLYTKDGKKLADGYDRVVIGDYGAYVEIDPKDIQKGNIQIKPGQEYRINDPKYAKNVKYHWYETKGAGSKVYYQQHGVAYADYKPNKYYISPDDIVIKNENGVSSFTDSSKSITNKYFDNANRVKNINYAFNENAGKTERIFDIRSGKAYDVPATPKYQEAKYNVFNMDGMEVYQPVDVRTDATVKAIFEGAKNVGKKDADLARLLSTMKVYLSDIEGASEAIEGSATIIFGKNINKISNYDNYVAEKIMPHEIGHEFGRQIDDLLFKHNDEAEWLKAIKADGSEIFKGKKVIDNDHANYKLMNEDLAESFRMFLTNSKAFKVQYPNRYAALKKGIIDLKVPDNMINKALDVSSIKVQPNAYKMLENERLTLEAQKQMLLNKTAEMSEKDAQSELEKIIKLQDNNYMNREFEELYSTLHPNQPLYTKEAVNDVKTTARLDVENEMVKKILNKYSPEEQEQIVKLVNNIADQFNNIYDREIAAKMMNRDRIIGYVPHQKRVPVDIPDKKTGNYFKFNQFDQSRTIKETIKEHNEKILTNNGYSDWDAFWTDYNSGNMDVQIFSKVMDETWEEDIAELLLMRGLKSNQLTFTKNFYNHIVENFGTVYRDIADVPAGVKLHASSEDIYDVLKANITHEEFNENAYTQLVNEARRDGKRITPELDEQLREQATSTVYDIEKLNQLVKEFGLSENYIKAFDSDKRNIEAFLKLDPITPISEKAFATLKNIDPRFSAFSVSDLIVDKLNKSGMLEINKQKGAFLDAFDFVQRLWKINATSANLGFSFRNALSNQYQEFLNIGYDVLNPKEQYRAARIISGKFDDKATIRVGNANYTEQQIMEKAQELGVLNGSLITNMIKNQDRETFLQRLGNIAKEVNKNVSDETNKKLTKVDKIKELLAEKLSEPDTLKNIAKSINPLDTNNFIAYRIGGKVNAFFENQSRLHLFLANLKQGKGFEEAADNVNKFLFDYEDLSDFEQNVMKRLIPFYTWLRKNIPLQIEQFFNNPRAFATYQKVVNNINDMTPQNERLTDSQKNQFAQDWMQLPFNTIDQNGAKQPTFFNPNLPLNDLDKLDLTQIGRNLFTSLTPFIKLPMELVMNKNVYFNNNISKGIGDSDDAPGYLQALMGGTKEKPAQMSPQLRYVLKNIGSLENISKILQASSQTREGQPISDKALAILKWLGGLSAYSYDVDKYTKWSDRDRLKQLRDIARKYGLIE